MAEQTSAAEVPESTEAFRQTLHRLIERAGFPHEADIVNAKNDVDRFLGIEVPEAPYNGPLYDTNTGAYLGNGPDPRTPPPLPVQEDVPSDVAAPVA